MNHVQAINTSNCRTTEQKQYIDRGAEGALTTTNRGSWHTTNDDDDILRLPHHTLERSLEERDGQQREAENDDDEESIREEWSWG